MWNHLSSRVTGLWTLCGVVLVAGVGALAAQHARQGTLQSDPHMSWRTDKGSADGSNYSALTQINRSNVGKLALAWTYATGDERPYTTNPIIIDQTMFVFAKNNSIVAIDATSGKEIWTCPPPEGGGGNRGIQYWESKDRSDRRILISWNSYLYAINAQTGKGITWFGDKGRVNLREGLGRDASTIGRIQSTSPGRVFENLIILGSAMGEAYVSPPGDIRAYDVRNGRLIWQFHTIPHPGEFGYDTWPKDAWLYTGGTNAWADMSVDEPRGIVYVMLGSPTYDFYGGDRKGDNLFGNSLVALDARTGKRLWHFQMIHHDLWDYDNVSSPQLVTITKDGKKVDVVAAAGKNGYLYVFDRVTGQPIWPIPEVAQPKSDVPGEWASPTQPIPSKPPEFSRHDPISPDEVNPYVITAEERATFRAMIAGARNEGTYTPPSLDRFTVHRPGHSGGSNLFSTSADPVTGQMFVVNWSGPSVLKLETSEAATANNNTWGPRSSDQPGPAERRTLMKIEPASAAAVERGQRVYADNCQSCHGDVMAGGGSEGYPLTLITDRLDDETLRTMIRKGTGGQMPTFAEMGDGSVNDLLAYMKTFGRAGGGPGGGNPYPVGVEGTASRRLYSGYGFAPMLLGPPWSTRTAYDLNTGTILWQIPVGDALGGGLEPGNNFGDGMYHGPKSTLAVTAGGLGFAGTRDRKLRAYDKDTGKVLWSTDLPAPSQGAPAVYDVDGREYVVIFANGGYYAYALPRASK